MIASMESVSWKRVPIVELCAAHVDCVNRTAPIVSEPTPFKMIRTTNVRNGFIDTENVRYVSEETYKRWTRRLVPKRGDVILTREAPLGDVGKIRTDDSIFLGQRLYHFRPDPNKLDADFLLYSLLHEDLQGQIRGFGAGATVEHMRLEDVPNLEINVPPLSVQQRFAGILSAYDELRENSQRRIRILEAMARALYREWFVYFRFPGYKRVPRVASSLGDIPRGWEVKRVPECVSINPRVVVSRDGEKPFVPMGCLANNSMLVTDIESRDGNSGSKFQNGDTLFARITPCLENGKTGFVQFLPDEHAVACGSTEFIVLRSRTLTPEFVYLLSRSDEFRGNAIKSMSGASGRQRVQERCFDEFKITHPPRALLDRFSAIVAPSFRLIHSLHLHVVNLRQTRDLLLPYLLSGRK
ncbi:MAG: restriction endonuclease subunit S [Burkholderiales bacterium]